MKSFLENWLQRVSQSDQKSYGKRELEIMIKSAVVKAGEGSIDTSTTCRQPISVNDLRRGDVFIHKLVGGKVRPWIVLKIHDDTVTCVAMSSGETVPNSVQSQCRYWPESFICPTVTSVNLKAATKEVTRPYTNLAHLSEIENLLREGLFSSRIRSISEIRERRAAKVAA